MKLMCTSTIIKISILVYVAFNSFSADFQREKGEKIKETTTKLTSCIVLDGTVEEKS